MADTEDWVYNPRSVTGVHLGLPVKLDVRRNIWASPGWVVDLLKALEWTRHAQVFIPFDDLVTDDERRMIAECVKQNDLTEEAQAYVLMALLGGAGGAGRWQIGG